MLINLTPHALTIHLADGDVATIPPSGKVARVQATSQPNGFIPVQDVPVPVVVNSFGAVSDLPDPAPDTRYVVSTLVLQALADLGDFRPDVLAPDTGATCIRDAAGRIVGVTQFQQLGRPVSAQ